MSAVTEYFTQRAALAKATAEPLELRDRRRALLERARQKRHAADTLWIANQTAEALPLFVAALDLYCELVSLGPASEEPAELDEAPSLAERLSALGFTSDQQKQVLDATQRARDASLPERNEDGGRAEIDLQRELEDALDLLDEHLDTLAANPRRLRTRRFVRTALLVLGSTAAVALGLWLVLRPTPLAAHASAVWENEPRYTAEKAVDHDPATEWLLPNGAPGTLDVSLAGAREVTAVTLTNGHNPPYEDRAIKAYRVELYAGTRKVGEARGTFERLEHAPRPTRVAVRGRGVDRVRLVVESHHGLGAALAELTVE